MPWREVYVDCVGNWKINLNGITLEFNALTMIDPVTRWFEIVQIDSKQAELTLGKLN